MNFGPRLDLRQSQQLVMTPQLQQAIKLLALSNLEVEAFIGDALEANPLLELGERAGDADSPEPASPEPTSTDAGDFAETAELVGLTANPDEAPLDIAPEAVDPDAGSPGAALEFGPGLSGGAVPGEDFDFDRGDASPTSLSEHLLGQVGAAAYNDREAAIARHLIGLLDESGYLTLSLRDIAGDLGIAIDDVEDALLLVQSLDPTGIGARDLAECLALQAREADRYDPCMARLIDNLDLLARGNIRQLLRICEVDEEDFADMLAELRGYDPRPGLRFGGEDAEEPVVPDILLRAGRDGGWDIAINPATLPRLVINRSYYVELKRDCANRQARGWLSEKLADANWLVKALDQRQKTILKVAAEIVKQQEGFFRAGVSQLRPLTLKAVADAIDMHESTVSRVTSNKYLHCARGTFELKYFFSSGVSSADGESEVSAEAVKAQIRALIDAEDADDVLSDDKLVELLNSKGYGLARRTVAKYREAIGLGSSIQRRRQKKLAAAM